MASTAKSSLKLSLVTIVSRITGLVRDHYQAVFFGTGPVSAAWEIAYMMPNMLRNLLAEGVLSQSFVPIYSAALKDGEDRAKRVAGVILMVLFFVLLAIVLIGLLLFPFLLPLYTGRSGEDAKLVIQLAMILFPFILTTSLASIFMGMANTRQSFFIPSLSPVLLNLILILGFLCIAPFHLEDKVSVRYLALVTICGGVIQLVFQIWHVMRNGWSPSYNLNFSDPAIHKIYTLMAPAVLGASIFQLNQLVDVALASYLIEEKGAITGLRFAHRLIQLPTGVVGVALSTAILPVLSRAIRENKSAEIPAELAHALSFSFFLNVPAAIGLYMLGPDIINLLFYGGDWTLESTAITWVALQFYCIGIPAYSANRILTSSFYAHQDTKRPVRILIGIVVLNFAMNLTLVPFLKQGGLAFSTSFCALLNFVLLHRMIRSHIPGARFYSVLKSLASQAPGYIALLGVLLIAQIYRAEWLRLFGNLPLPLTGPRAEALLMVGPGIAIAGAVYGVCGILFRVPELNFLRRRFGLTGRQ